MDDTIIVATSREAAIKKLKILNEFCATSGMVVNAGKTKFMVINGKIEDKEPLVCEDLTVNNCEEYCYLGAIFNQDGSPESASRAHFKAKHPHLTKFASFVKKNADAPFYVTVGVRCRCYLSIYVWL